MKEYENCKLCRRLCGVDRSRGELGFCRSGAEMKAARAALHMWEEPPISGDRGSGAIFFSGCSLSCVFCQNHDISRGNVGKELTPRELADIMKKLMTDGAHNINFVTPTHFAPSIKEAVLLAKKDGVDIPMVYNTSSYETVETLKLLEGIIDIYLADFKYCRSKTAALYSSAPDYPGSALAAIDEMVRQRPVPIFEDGLMKSGVIIRLLELPSHTAEAKLSLSKLYSRYGDNVYFSLMSQYTPENDPPPPINRALTIGEYREFTDYAAKLGIKNAFVQDRGSVGKEYIPEFDNTGV